MKFRLIMLIVLLSILIAGGVALPSNGTLYVASKPSGATILINGMDYGTTDQFVKNVPAGNLNLTLTKEGYQPKTVLVDVPAGGLKALAPVTLTKSDGAGVPGGTGTLYVASKPSGATILIDDQDYGTTNQFVKNVPAGSQNLMLIKEGYQPYTMVVDVPPGGLKALAPVTLTRSSVGEIETIQAAVDAATEGDILILKAGTYSENIVIQKSLTIIGAGPGLTIINGNTGMAQNEGGVINVTKPFPHASYAPNVTLVGMTITQGTANYGGGIFNGGGDLTLSQVSITNNIASFSGGGIYNQEGTVITNGSFVAENTVKVGAGVMNDGGTFVMNDGSSITGNTADIGGGLVNIQGTLVMNNGSSITDNSATYDGGGIYSYFYSTITLNGGTITGNTAETGIGGGIYTDSSSTINLSSGTVSGNNPDDVNIQFDVTYEGTVVGRIGIDTKAWMYVLTVDGLTPDTEYWLACEGRPGLIASATTNATGGLLLQGVLNPAPNLRGENSMFFVGTGSPPPASGTVELDGKECRGSWMSTTIFGTLTSDGAPLSGQEVDFYEYDPVTLEIIYPSFGSDTTDSNGEFCKVFFGGHTGYPLAVQAGGQWDMNVEKATVCPICK